MLLANKEMLASASAPTKCEIARHTSSFPSGNLLQLSSNVLRTDDHGFIGAYSLYIVGTTDEDALLAVVLASNLASKEHSPFYSVPHVKQV
jgi:hypothetical protein